MNSQNIGSNKSDFNWSTSFSYTGVQRIFWNPAPCTTFLWNGGIYDDAQLRQWSVTQIKRKTRKALRSDSEIKKLI